MPLPKEPLKLHGGCNCKALRYEVSAPPWDERPLTPYKTVGADVGDLRIPAVYICQCNDCRRATSAIMPTALVCDVRTVTVSVISKTATTDSTTLADNERSWQPGQDFFDPSNPALEDTYITAFNSSPKCSRWFCCRCGTMIAYSVHPGVIPPEWKWPPMLDIWLGTVDREDIAKEYMRPERMLWCDMGVPWIRRMAREGAGGIPEHPLTKIDKVVGDDVDEDASELAALAADARGAGGSG